MAEPKFHPLARQPARIRQKQKAMRRNMAFRPVEPDQQPPAWRVERAGGLGVAFACNDCCHVMAVAGKSLPIYQVGDYEEADLYCWVCDVKLLWVEQLMARPPRRAA